MFSRLVGCMRLPRLLPIVAAVAGCAFVSPSYAAKPGAVDIDRPPGKLIDIGTHSLYLYCAGSGSPTVVFDTGLGGSSLEWLPVQQALATHTRVCAYDRAGYGWSDSGPGPRTSLRNAIELRALLTNAGIEPPYVLAGHSFGGYNVQLFASLYPKSVAGLVLVDSSHAGQVERFEAPPIGVSTAPDPNSEMLISQPPPAPAGLPARLSVTVNALMSTDFALHAIADELRYFRVSAQQVGSAAPWPDVPVVVLTRGQRVWPGDHRGKLMEALWMRLQDELATRNPRSLHILVRGSGHHIHLDEPQVVTRAVELIVDERRGSTSHKAAPFPHQTNFRALLAAHTFADDTLFADLYTEHPTEN